MGEAGLWPRDPLLDYPCIVELSASRRPADKFAITVTFGTIFRCARRRNDEERGSAQSRLAVVNMTLRIALVLGGLLLLIESTLAQSLPQPFPSPPGREGSGVKALAVEAVPPDVVTEEGSAVQPAYAVPYVFNPTFAETWWASADYMMGWLRERNLPPLVTTSPAGTDRADAGVIGRAGTTILFGGQPLESKLQSGGRLEVGHWFADDFAWAVGGFFLGGEEHRFSASSDGTPILGRPFIDTATGQFATALISFPNLFNGSININASSDPLVGAHFNVRERFYADEAIRAEALVGYRFLHYGEAVDIASDFITNEAPALPGTRLQVNDRFTTSNDFHGGDIGVRVEMFHQALSLELLGKIAVGNLYRRVHIIGDTTVTAPNQAPVTSEGGLLALSSNIGSYGRSDWVAVPELGLTVGYQMRSNLRLKLGYTFLMMTDMARAGDQIDITVNQDLLPPPLPNATPLRPAFGFQRTDLWMQSLNFGIEYRF